MFEKEKRRAEQVEKRTRVEKTSVNFIKDVQKEEILRKETPKDKEEWKKEVSSLLQRTIIAAKPTKSKYAYLKFLVKVAKVHAILGMKEKSMSILDEVTTQAKLMENDHESIKLLLEIGKVQASFGFFQKAIETAELIKSNNHSSQLLFAIGQAQLSEDMFEEATDIARLMKSNYLSSKLLIEIGKRLALAGRKEEALATFDKAISRINLIRQNNCLDLLEQLLNTIVEVQKLTDENSKI